jgi:AcrR family transcriptional regulator
MPGRSRSGKNSRSFPVSPTLRQPADVLGPRAARTVAQILEAAKEIFLSHGYAGTTVDEIARVAGISRASFYTYFPSKRDVLLKLGADSAGAGMLMVEYASELRRPVDDAQLRHYVAKCFAVLDKEAGFAFAWTQAAHQDEEIRLAGMKGHLKVCQSLGRVLGARRGRAFASPTAQGLALLSQLERAWTFCQLYADPSLEAAVQGEIAANIGSVLRDSLAGAAGASAARKVG